MPLENIHNDYRNVVQELSDTQDELGRYQSRSRKRGFKIGEQKKAIEKLTLENKRLITENIVHMRDKEMLREEIFERDCLITSLTSHDFDN
jgi:hypothetical protein